MMTLQERGSFTGHKDWVTSLATVGGHPRLLVSASRDKEVMVWDVNTSQSSGPAGHVQKSLCGHDACVSCIALSSDAKYALSASWDRTVRLWELDTGKTLRILTGHTKDVSSVAFSPDQRMILTGSRDQTVKVWNTVGECKWTLAQDVHHDWVSCVLFSPKKDEERVGAFLFVTAGWDKVVTVCTSPDFAVRHKLRGHTGAVLCLDVSPDGSLLSSGGQDGSVMLWDLGDGKLLYSLEASGTITAVRFSPVSYWVCVATDTGIRVWDLESKQLIALLRPESLATDKGTPWCVSLAWRDDGQYLFAGLTDGKICVYEVVKGW